MNRQGDRLQQRDWIFVDGWCRIIGTPCQRKVPSTENVTTSCVSDDKSARTSVDFLLADLHPRRSYKHESNGCDLIAPLCLAKRPARRTGWDDLHRGLYACGSFATLLWTRAIGVRPSLSMRIRNSELQVAVGLATTNPIPNGNLRALLQCPTTRMAFFATGIVRHGTVVWAKTDFQSVDQVPKFIPVNTYLTKFNVTTNWNDSHVEMM